MSGSTRSPRRSARDAVGKHRLRDSLPQPQLESVTFALTADVWRAAAAIAGWRVAINDEIRSPDRDRGADKNRLNDIQGLIGELVGIRALEKLDPPPTRLRHDILDLTGPVDDVDVVAVLPSGVELRLETKCHLDEPNKSLFLINERAHERSGERASIGYIPVIGKLGQARVYAGRLIPHDEVDRWAVKPFRDPARAISLNDLCVRYFGAAWSTTRSKVSASAGVATAQELFVVFEGARAMTPPDPVWHDLAAAELVDAVCSLLGD